MNTGTRKKEETLSVLDPPRVPVRDGYQLLTVRIMLFTARVIVGLLGLGATAVL